MRPVVDKIECVGLWPIAFEDVTENVIRGIQATSRRYDRLLDTVKYPFDLFDD